MPCNACLLPARNLMSRCKDVLVKVYSKSFYIPSKRFIKATRYRSQILADHPQVLQKSLYTIAPPFVVVVFYVKSLRGNGTSFSAVSGCTQIERTITLILSDGEAVFSILLLLFPEIGQTPLCWSTPC